MNLFSKGLDKLFNQLPKARPTKNDRMHNKTTKDLLTNKDNLVGFFVMSVGIILFQSMIRNLELSATSNQTQVWLNEQKGTVGEILQNEEWRCLL